MQRPSLAHFSRQLSLRYVDLLLPRARRSGRYQAEVVRSLPTIPADALYLHAATFVAHLMLQPSSRMYLLQPSPRITHLPLGCYQAIFTLRGPPRIGIPHLVATKFKMLRFWHAH